MRWTILSCLIAGVFQSSLPLTGVGYTSSSAPVAYVQSASSGIYPSTGSGISISISPTAGDCLVVATIANAAISSVKDSAGNSLTAQTGVVLSAQSGYTFKFYYEKNVPSGITSVAVNIATGNLVIGVAAEYSGLSTAAPADAVDAAGSYQGSTDTWITGSMTPTAGKNEVICGFVYDFGGYVTYTATSPYHIRLQAQLSGLSTTYAFADQIVTSTSGSYAPTGTGTSTQLGAVGATYTQ